MALLLVGCAGEDPALRKEIAGLRSEIRTMQRENEELVRKVDALSLRVEVLAARNAARAGEPRAASAGEPRAASAPARTSPATSATPTATATAASAPLVPPHLKVVKLEPSRPVDAPPIPTDTPVRDPGPAAPRAPSAQGATP